jgi:hypothetical protein
MVPGQGSRPQALYAAKMGTIPLPTVDVHAATQTPQEARSDTPEPLPQKTISAHRNESPALRKEDAAIVKKLRHVGPPGTTL